MPTGFLLMADISGYTMYLERSELEHARDTLATLLEVLVSRTRPPLVVSKLEGDAVLSYTPDSGLMVGQTLVEIVEDVYVAFRRAIERMVLNNSCRCNACANVSTLDLKLFVHHGEFAHQKVGGAEELFGPDVVLTHRLLKNDIREATGITAYTAFTAAAAQRLGLEGMTRHRLDYEDAGEVEVLVMDMHPVWAARKDEAVVRIDPAQVVMEASTTIALTPEQVWDYLADLEFRQVLIGSDRQEIVDLKGGRVAQGSTFLCYHGNQVIAQEVIEWRPFHRIVTRDRLPMAGGRVQILDCFDFEEVEGGSRFTQTAAHLTGPLIPRIIARLFMMTQRKASQRDIEAFRDAIEADHGSRAGVTADRGTD